MVGVVVVLLFDFFLGVVKNGIATAFVSVVVLVVLLDLIFLLE